VSVLDKNAAAAMKRAIAAGVAVMALFMMMFLCGMGIAGGVAEEKSNRIVEILLAKVRPWHLLAGKIAGLVVVALVQILALLIVGIGASIAAKVFDAPTDSIGIAVNLLIWFVPGFILFATVYAVAGALVSRQEDINQVVLPVNVIQILTLVGPVQAMTHADSQLVRILSVVPGFSWATMPVRMAATTVGWGEIVLAYAAMVFVTAALVWIGGRIYAGGLLRVGGIIKVSDALRGSADSRSRTAGTN
jgi:ABC-2 type transport system permease protein